MAGKLNIAKLAERLAQLNSRGGGGSGINFINIKDGRNVVRVLPPRQDSDDFAQEVWVHYGVGKTDKSKGVMAVCPTTLDENASCPVCELARQYKSLSKKKEDSYDKMSKSLWRKKRVYMNAISRDEDLSGYKQGDDGKWTNAEGESESPVKVLAVGASIYKDIVKIICDPEYGDITDPKEGLDLIITKSGQGQFNTEYDVKTVRKESPVGFDQWETCMIDLKQLTKAKTYDELVALLEGKTADSSTSSDTDGDDQDEGGSTTVPDATPEQKAEETKLQDDLQSEIQAALARRKQQGKK